MELSTNFKYKVIYFNNLSYFLPKFKNQKLISHLFLLQIIIISLTILINLFQPKF